MNFKDIIKIKQIENLNQIKSKNKLINMKSCYIMKKNISSYSKKNIFSNNKVCINIHKRLNNILLIINNFQNYIHQLN